MTDNLGRMRRHRRPIFFLVLIATLGANICLSASRSSFFETGACLAAVVGSALVFALSWKGTCALLQWPCRFTGRQLIICFTVVVVALATCSSCVVVVFPRIRRAYDHWRLVSHDGIRQRLSVVPVDLTLPAACDGVELSTGYASMSIPADWKVRIRQKEAVVQLQCYDGTSVALLPPRIMQQPLDVYLSGIRVADDERSRLLRDIAADPFSWHLGVLNVGPKSICSVLVMSDGEWLRYRRQTLDKALAPDIDNGAGVFSTKHVRGVVGFGRNANPGWMTATILSTERPIAQTLCILSPSAEQSRSRLLSLIATYRFISDLPAERTMLGSLIRHNVERDARFVAEDSQSSQKKNELSPNRSEASTNPL